MNESKKTTVLGIDVISITSVLLVALCLAASLFIGRLFNAERATAVSITTVFTYYWPALLGALFFGRFAFLLRKDPLDRNLMKIFFCAFGFILAIMCLFLCYHIILWPINRGPSPINRFFRSLGTRYHTSLQIVYIVLSAIISISVTIIFGILKRLRSVV